jgi:hypothetical protein
MSSNTTFPAAEFSDRLDELLSAAARAGVSSATVETELKKRLAGLRARAAANLSLSTTPLTYDGYGKPRS